MKSLSEALASMENTLIAQEKSKPTLPPGLTSEDGKSIMPALGIAANRGEIAAIPQNGQMMQQQKSSQNAAQSAKLKDDPEGQDQLTMLLSQVYASQKTYGDKAEMMGYRDAMFQMILADFPFSKIKEAFVAHLQRSQDLPTPSDIYNRLNPPEPTPDWAAYVGLRKKSKDGEYLVPSQREYLKWCEGWAVRKKEKYEEAREEIERLETAMIPQEMDEYA